MERSASRLTGQQIVFGTIDLKTGLERDHVEYE
jgi:hypothetical protein